MLVDHAPERSQQDRVQRHDQRLPAAGRDRGHERRHREQRDQHGLLDVATSRMKTAVAVRSPSDEPAPARRIQSS